MNEQLIPKEEILNLIKEIEGSPDATQRELSIKLNMSLGKTNYLLKELFKKGLIKAKAFSHAPNKMKRMSYFLTQKGLEEKFRLTYYFLKRKEAEFNLMKEAWEELQKRMKERGEEIESSHV